MNLDQVLLEQHCNSILKSPRIKNKIVVLCEGTIPVLDDRPSPQSYKKMEQMPDANFYKACVPKWWSQYRPEFFNCGDRKNVVNTYFTLLDKHHQAPQESFLAPEKLYAIVDLDIPIHYIEQEYRFRDTEEIFHHLYQRAKVNVINAEQHRIWVTGLIYKEAYFVLPELQDIFDNEPLSPTFQGKPLQLADIYIAISNDMEADIDLQFFFDRLHPRIQHCTSLDFHDITALKNSWQHQFLEIIDDTQRRELVYALLTIRKLKSYWNQIIPSPHSGWTREAYIFREQLSLRIGRQFYSNQDINSEHHLPVFFKILSHSLDIA